MTKVLPRELTSYDLLKTFAVVFMVIDHIGYFFFPEENWWRVAGRLCVPVWFFLIGYAQSRDFGPRLWIGAGILVFSALASGLYLFPLNILVTMLIIRFVIDRAMGWALFSRARFVVFCGLVFLLILPTNFIAEYGTQGMLLAIFGYLLRHRERLGITRDFIVNYGVFLLPAFAVPQFVMHGFLPPQFYVLFGGTIGVLYMLYCFRPAVFPGLTEKLPSPLVWLLQLTGRRTLEIYVAHIVLFEAIALLQGQERFGFFDWRLMPSIY